MFDTEVLSFLKQAVPAFSSLDANGFPKMPFAPIQSLIPPRLLPIWNRSRLMAFTR
jgi:hypothetical protein